MKLTIPANSLVALVGVSGSGKSFFARRHFQPTETLSSDQLRGWITDDENDQSASSDAFATLRFIADRRLRHGKLTVIDATNLLPAARKPLVTLARKHQIVAVGIVFALPDGLCEERNARPGGRNLGRDVLERQGFDLRRSLGSLKAEGFEEVYIFHSLEEVEGATLERQPERRAPASEQTDLQL